jgi:hypothetical protein
MINIELEWKDKPVSLPIVEAKLKAKYPEYCGCSAHSMLVLHFDCDSLPEETIEEIKDYWDGLKKNMNEFTKYKTQADLDVEKKSKKESAKAKLTALGLDPEELSALLGE